MTDPITDPNWSGHVEAAAATAEVNPDVVLDAYRAFPASWQFRQTFNNVSDLHPSANLNDPLNPAQAAQAASLHLNAINGVLSSSLLREPTPTEQYIGLKVGPDHAPDVISLPGNLPLSSVVPQSVIDQDPAEFSGVQTLGEYRSKAAVTMKDVSYKDPNPGAADDASQAPQASLPTGSKVTPDQLRNYLIQEVRRQGLEGYVPKDGPKYGIAKGSAEEWANLFTGLAAHESGLDNNNVGDIGQFGTGSRGLFQLSQGDAPGYGLNGGHPFSLEQLADPVTNTQSAVTIAKTLMQRNDSIQGGMGQYWGPISREGWTPGKGRDANLPWADWAAGKSGSAPQLMSNYNVNANTLTPANRVTADEQAAIDQQKRQNTYNVVSGIMDTAIHDSDTGFLLRNSYIPTADPSFRVTAKTLQDDPRLAGIPVEYQAPLLDSWSQADYDARLRMIEDRVSYERRVDSLSGVSGLAARLGGAALDPIGWMAGSVSPLSEGAAKAAQFGRAIRMAARGADFALGSALVSVPRAMEDPTLDRDAVLQTMAGGFLAGAVHGYFGAVHPSIKPEMAQLEATQDALFSAIDQKASQPGAYTGVPSANPSGSSVGAASVDGYREPVRADSADWLDLSVADAYKDKAARPLNLPRMDLAGQLKESENPVVAALGSTLVEDGVGNADHSAVMRAATVEAKMLQDRFDTELGAGYQAAFKDWSERNDVSWFGKRQKEREFREAVADYVDNPDRAIADQADPAVKQFGATLQDFWSTYHDLGQNPGALDGSIRAAIPGLANIPKNELYFPHMWDWDAFGEADRRFGSAQMKQLLTNAVKDALPEVLPSAQKEIDEAAAAYEKAQGKLSKASEGLAKADATVSKRTAELETAKASLKDGEVLHEKYQQRLDKATEGHAKATERHSKATAAHDAAKAEHERLTTEAPTIHRDDVAERVGSALYTGIRNVQAGQEVHLSNLLSGQDLDGLRAFLGKNSSLSSSEIEAVIQHLTPNSDKAEGPISRLKHRTTLNVHHTEMLRDPKTGEKVPVTIKDLMNRDSLQVATMYNRQLANRVALARVQVENPRFDPQLHADTDVPRYLVDGIRNEADWERITNQVKAVADEMNQDPKSLQKDLDRLNFVYNTMTGQLQRQDKGTLGSMLRLLRKYNFSRALGQVGFAHVAQTWSVVAQMGLKAAMENMPTLRDFIRDAKTGQLVDQFAREIEYISDAGTDMIRGLSHLSVDDFGNVVGQDGFKKLEDLANRANRTTMMISGMAPMLALQQKWAAKAALARFVFDAEGKMPLNMRRMAALGISEDDRALIAKNILEHRGTITTESGQAIPVLNLEKWDPEARHAISYAINRWSRRIAQENDLGQMNMMLGSEMGKLMWQFRMFMFGAYAKQTLHNLHMRDFESASMVLGTTALGALAYAAQTYLQSIGRSDREQFLEERLSPKKLALAGIQRSPTSSVVPMGADLMSYAMGFDPIFDARASGTPAQGILSNPTFSLLDQGVRALHGVTKVATGQGQWTQQDQRAFVGTLPGGNFLPVVWASNAMMQRMPTHDPTQHKTH